MKRTVWTFGLISGGIMSAMMLLTLPFMYRIGFDKAEVLGYTAMVAAFLLVFFGVRSYRDNHSGGVLSFGRGLAVGMLIAAVASACYVATWEVIYYRLTPDFTERYSAYVIEQQRAASASEEAIAARTAQMERFQALYRNPLFNVAITFMEPFWVGAIVALVSAGVLRRSADGARARGAGSTPVPIG
jgi:amino acid transporter